MLCPMILTMIMKNKHYTTSICMTTLIFNLSTQYSETSKIGYSLGGDLISFWMTNLSLWIMMIISLIKLNNMKTMNKINSLMIIVLMVAFYCWNFMTFFIFFETSMVMIVLIVVSWGYQPERVEATMFMIILTSLFSLPMFISMMNNFNKLSFWFLENQTSIWNYLSFMLIFMVKMPVYFIHIWLPKVHVESPIQGSMILAAIMLKLGCFGMIHTSKMNCKITMENEFIIMAFSMWTALILSIVCNIQSDLKSLVAYSSVVHMTMTFVSISLTKSKSMHASIIIMLGHGTCSSAMFFMCNQMYKTSKSRSVILNKGIMNTIPTASTMWFFLCMMNAPMPPSMNIMGEILTFKAVITWSMSTLIVVFLIMLFSSCYSMIVFCIASHGKPTKAVRTPPTFTSKSMTITMMHIIPTITITAKASMTTI